jgi:hypothetical protein
MFSGIVLLVVVISMRQETWFLIEVALERQTAHYMIPLNNEHYAIPTILRGEYCDPYCIEVEVLTLSLRSLLSTLTLGIQMDHSKVLYKFIVIAMYYGANSIAMQRLPCRQCEH